MGGNAQLATHMNLAAALLGLIIVHFSGKTGGGHVKARGFFETFDDVGRQFTRTKPLDPIGKDLVHQR